MWFIALAFLGVGTVSAQTETAEGTSPWTRRKFRVETDPSKFDKLGCRW